MSQSQRYQSAVDYPRSAAPEIDQSRSTVQREILTAAAGWPYAGSGLSGAHSSRRRLGQVPAVVPSPGARLSTGAYVAASIVGATLGGALVGYVATQRKEGAVTGALFTGGMAALSDGLMLAREDMPSGAVVLALAGFGGLGWTFMRFQKGLRT